ncbi:MAG TPA: FAD-dependent oxidoreductase [Chloroflexi bacterium]|nr:FAD-dependent oxidoreductase [Chloroflexota bacterium]
MEEIKEEYKEVKGKYDVIIIGAGLVGAVIARWLSKYELDILLIDKEPDVGTGTSKANTAIVHAGYDSPFGTLRGKLVVKGNRMFYPMCEELDVPYKMCGTYVVALTDEDMKTLERLMENGRKKGVPGLEIISGEEMRHREPLINPEVKGALYAPTGGISDPFALTVAAAENAVMNGVKLMLKSKALDCVSSSIFAPVSSAFSAAATVRAKGSLIPPVGA